MYILYNLNFELIIFVLRVIILSEFKIYPVLYDNWLFLTLLSFPFSKNMEEEKEKEVVKPVFQERFEIHLIYILVTFI